MKTELQFLDDSHLKHLLKIEGMSDKLILSLIDKAEPLLHTLPEPVLQHKTVAHIFFEPSTRTLTSFALAAQKLGAHVVNINIPTSATCKGESLRDTLENLAAMGCDIFVVRHGSSGALDEIVTTMGNKIPFINAGDGQHAHPSQALLDMMTLKQHKPDFTDLSVAVIGDLKHSRVARSELVAMHTLGIKDIRAIGPKSLLPDQFAIPNVQVSHDLEKGLKDVDVIYILRLQKERMQVSDCPNEAHYFKHYGITKERLKIAKPDAIVMHPGPINRGIELSNEVADGEQSVILEQVRNGLAMRMTILSHLAENWDTK